jgi:hypothetical protein
VQFQKDNGRDSRNELPALTLTHSDELLLTAIGERMWIFTSDCAKRYVVAAQLIVDQVVPVPSAKGRYTVVPREGSTIKYGMVTGADAKATIRSLSLTRASKLGSSVMAANTVQRLSEEDDLVMEEFAKALNRAAPGVRWKLKGCA